MFFVRFIELAQQSHISDLRHVKSLITNQFSPHLNLKAKLKRGKLSSPLFKDAERRNGREGKKW